MMTHLQYMTVTHHQHSTVSLGYMLSCNDSDYFISLVGRGVQPADCLMKSLEAWFQTLAVYVTHCLWPFTFAKLWYDG